MWKATAGKAVTRHLLLPFTAELEVRSEIAVMRPLGRLAWLLSGYCRWGNSDCGSNTARSTRDLLRERWSDERSSEREDGQKFN
jgi:hypothetical protein